MFSFSDHFLDTTTNNHRLNVCCSGIKGCQIGRSRTAVVRNGFSFCNAGTNSPNGTAVVIMLHCIRCNGRRMKSIMSHMASKQAGVEQCEISLTRHMHCCVVVVFSIVLTVAKLFSNKSYFSDSTKPELKGRCITEKFSYLAL
ncbi:conserved hypothetical protein [Trichinella spiralis]|uniref:hypothetical protein n=1 Tax=Trichinella spiralis TaxID=6334 RepID=UPI0001EFEC05|nr:conserved hypothetical protein [Trichinella spiralis]